MIAMKPLIKNSIIVILLFGTAIYLPSCKEEMTLPVVALTYVSEITQTSAITGGTVTDDGDAPVTEFGICWSTSPNPTIGINKKNIGAGIGSFTVSIDGLTANTKYFVRAYAISSAGTSYGNEVTFTTASTVPIVKTTSVTEITVASAVIGSSITSDGGQNIIDKGICWATNPNPTIDIRRTSWGSFDGTKTFPDIIYDLHPSTKYYVRAYAINAVGIAYGDELTFTTLAVSPIIFNPDLAYGSVADADGNLYKIIQIGNQTWMAENLRTTKFNDGESIPLVTGDIEWEKLTTPGYCWYDNDPSSYKDPYGALYNWYAVNTEKLCPEGWHVPANAEWNILSNYLGADAGGKMEETGTIKWVNPNTGASNVSGFTAIPGGSRDPFYQEWRYSTFGYLGYNSSWWSATEHGSPNVGYAAWLFSDKSTFSNEFQAVKIAGLSVRCLKD